MDSLTPKDHAEAVALFRAEIIGSLTCRELVRGELAEELRALVPQIRSSFAGRRVGGQVFGRHDRTEVES